MDLEYEIETVSGEFTVRRRLTIHDPSELAIEKMLDRVLTDMNDEVSDERQDAAPA